MVRSSQVVPAPDSSVVPPAGIDVLLAQIRPEWHSRNLIARVKRLIPVDASSACQRVLNAAIHDLRLKIVVAGLDIASEVAEANKLPPVKRAEDIEDDYSVTNTLELSYRMGILNRPAWKRLRRAYDIRGDLEHEDDEYEAGIEDVLYVFKTCIETVLSRDPIELPRVADVREFVESPDPVAFTTDFLDEYDEAPQPRQREIMQFLIETALSAPKTDRVRLNCLEALRLFSERTANAVKIDLPDLLQRRANKRPFTVEEMRVAGAAGIVSYLKTRKVLAYFDDFAQRLEAISYRWTKYEKHADILDELKEVGG